MKGYLALELEGNTEIYICPKTTFTYAISFDNEELAKINSMRFTCEDLEIDEEMLLGTVVIDDITYNCYYINISSSITENYANPLSTKYTIYVTNTDGVEGAYNNGILTVEENKNI